MPRYEILVDGERKRRARSADEVRKYLRSYRDEHRETDPAAAHVQILELGALAWLTGGRLVPRERFLV